MSATVDQMRADIIVAELRAQPRTISGLRDAPRLRSWREEIFLAAVELAIAQRAILVMPDGTLAARP